MIKHRLLCTILILSITAIARANSVLYLAAPGQFPQENPCPLLVREIARQSLLIAARDGLGLHTRDAVLREWDSTTAVPPDAQGKPALLMDMHTTKDPQTMRVDLFSLGAEKTQLLSDTILTPRESGWVSVPLSLESLEPLSRGKYLDQLKSAGFTGSVPARGDKDISDGVDDLLYQTTLLAPLSALQQVHAAIYESGESPARLSALVRAYANLGQLTRFQFGSINKVMTARSLLYAQRMVNEDPDSPFALYNRAYAFALTGLQAAALQDIEEARQHEDELSNANKPVPPVPAWVSLLEPYCKYDVDRLAALTPQGDRRLPLDSLLVYLAEENCGSMRQFMGIANAAMQVNDKCFRIMDGVAETLYWNGIAGEVTVQEAQVMLSSLPGDIKLLPVIPQTTQQALTNAQGNPDHIGNLANVCNSFITATEPAEPSFTTAGRILQETNFAHVARRAAFLKDIFQQDSSGYVNSMQRLIADHPFKAYINSLKFAASRRANLLKDMPVPDPQWQMHYMLGQTIGLPRGKEQMTGVIGWSRMYDNPDGTADDTERMLFAFDHQDDHQVKNYAPRILEISPYSGAAAAAIIRLDWQNAAAHLDDWNTRFAHQPAVQWELASHYIKANQPDQAEPVLLRLMDFSPDAREAQALAKIRLDRGDETGWLDALKRVLDDPGLQDEHPTIQVEIARHFMGTGAYDRARPYYESAANSGSTAAREELATCLEYQGDFEAAEQLMMDVSKATDEPRWLFWCLRTGHGHLDNARSTAEAWAQEKINKGMIHNYLGVANIYFLEHRLDDAKKYYQIEMKQEHSALAALQLANICIEQKDTDGRDAAWLYCSQHCAHDLYGYDYTVYAAFAKMALQAGDKIPTNTEVEKFLKQIHAEPANQTGVRYFHGRQLQFAGDLDAAKESFHHALLLPSVPVNSYGFACVALHELGEKASLPTPIPAPGN